MTGRLLNNRYIVTERIGIGGMAEVYQGQDNVLGRSVAIKIMLPQYAEDATFTARFRQEAAAAANLSSPYIVNVYDWGNDNGVYYIVMEYLRGSDLKTAINQRGAINQRKVAEIGSQVCQALSVAHNQDIIHRDIKPQNIMIQPDGNVKVMDFGIARAKNSVKAKTSSVLGTAHYISPEQAQGKELTPASDIYSLGVVLYEAATGQLPFDGPDAISVATKQVKEAPIPPREINPDIDPAFEAIIMQALSKDPNARFSTARAMRAALNDYLAGRPVVLPGFSGDRTAVLDNAPDIPVVGPAAEYVDETKVMPTAVGKTGRVAGVAPVNKDYRNGNTSGGGGRRILPIVIAIIAALAVVGIAAAMIFGGGGGEGQNVPDVTGKTVEQATEELIKAGFEVGKVEEVYSDKVEPGKVVSQTPRGNSKHPKGTKVDLEISKGGEKVQVPDLTDMTASEARQALQAKGLKYEAGPAEHSEDVAENHVARQSPVAGEEVAKGSTVVYFLSAGPEGTTIPDVVGSLEGAAQSALENAGFKVTIDRVNSNDVPEGHVISQSPAAGEKAKSGSSVSIVVSSGSHYYDVSAYVNTTAGGEISPGYTSVQDGGSVTFYVTVYNGYQITGLYDSNGNGYYLSGGAFTVNNIHSDLTVSVIFEQLPDPTPTPSSDSSASTETG